MRNRIRLTESDIHRIVKESVNRILKEAALNKSMRAHDKLLKEYYEDDYDDDIDEDDEYVLDVVEGLLEDYDDGERTQNLLNCFLDYENDMLTFDLNDQFPELCQRYGAALADLEEQNKKNLLEPEPERYRKMQ